MNPLFHWVFTATSKMPTKNMPYIHLPRRSLYQQGEKYFNRSISTVTHITRRCDAVADRIGNWPSGKIDARPAWAAIPRAMNVTGFAAPASNR
jgi:hypothetical protein